MRKNITIANPSERIFDNLYQFQFGVYKYTKVYVWSNSFESAFEEAIEWVDDNEPEHLYNVNEESLKEAAEELGFIYRKHNDKLFNDEEFEKIREQAEVDLTIIGHTTLKHGQYIANYEWNGHDVTDTDERAMVREQGNKEIATAWMLDQVKYHLEEYQDDLGPDGKPSLNITKLSEDCSDEHDFYIDDEYEYQIPEWIFEVAFKIEEEWVPRQ